MVIGYDVRMGTHAMVLDVVTFGKVSVIAADVQARIILMGKSPEKMAV